MAERTPSITSPSLSEGVDISPISTTDRRNSLEKHLQTRPDEQDLKNRHILLDTNTAPALQARQLELERQRATDNLKKGLEKRPERGELIERKCRFCFVVWGVSCILMLLLAAPTLRSFLISKSFSTHVSVPRYITGMPLVVTPSAMLPWHVKTSSLDYVTALVQNH
jgi:hypothetical protein